MSTLGRRVALLARSGVACDRLRGVLADAGADLVLEADPLTLDPAVLDAAQAQVVLVVLDAQTEETLDRFEAALQDPAIEVIFEEAELVAGREGWEAARWVRHLAAKLHRHDDVLPPGGESSSVATAAAGSDRLSASAPADEVGLDFAFEAVAGSETVPLAEADADNTAFVFDPLLAEIEFDGDMSIMAIDVDTDLSAAFDPSQDFSYYGDFDTVTGVGAASRDADFSQAFAGDFAALAISDPDDPAAANPDLDVAVDRPVNGNSKRVLELVSTDPATAAGERGHDETNDEGVAAEQRFQRDLASLASRIAGMELVDDRIAKGPAQAHGAVLVMAGIGGPDAVRQLIGALPENFPRPLLVQQRLDGGRYDKLVAQMQRATPVSVKLAEPGAPAIAGVIYILQAGIGIKVTAAGIHFIAGDDDVLAALPSADSAVLLLSGSDPAQIDAVMNHSWAGALVIGQSPDGCYDAAAPSALVARGGGSGQPAELAARLSERWRS